MKDADQSQQPNTVPPAELNPLLNPLLARNMGRWAEVYFTAAPEKREEAVHELLQQLKLEDSGMQDQGSASNSEPASNTLESNLQRERSFRHDLVNRPDRVAPAVVKVPEYLETCRRCGYQSGANQKFCGMCGARLDPESDNSASEHRLREEERLGEQDNPPDDLTTHQVETEPDSSSRGGYWQYSRHESAPGYAENDHLFEFAESSNSYSYRIIIGLALAVLIGTLTYMAWRGGQTASSLSRQAPQPAAAQTPARETKDQNTVSSTPPASNATPPSTAAPSPGRSAAEEPSEARENPKPAPPADKQTRAYKPRVQTTQSSPVQSGGAEELSMAQRYLDSSNGRRKPAEAADWLWKAIAKQNTQATVLLSDLYLHGDGVPKNCDQARILLDAAARKGNKDAGERLRHMQSYGCQ